MKQQTGTLDASPARDPSRQAMPVPQGEVLRQEVSSRQPSRASSKAHGTEAFANPLVILAAITLGLPVLAMMLVIGVNSGVQEGTLATLTTFVVLSAFVVAAIFEIKRLADLPSDQDHP
ncbi:hypothetical protein [Microvirga sp. TS319]|uniref:hypothetical protein n=1 Tax=Microvirga sp. TS319 TaxID=3241165 RepID=UPI00351A432A